MAKTTTNKTFPRRIQLTDDIVQRHQGTVFNQPPALLAKKTGLPYLLVYNVIHRRVRSISRRHYARLFREPPPEQIPDKVDGTFFRQMVDLWRYLHPSETRMSLTTYLLGKPPKSRDDRIFTGRIKSVDYRLEQRMADRFAHAGLDRDALAQWIDEFSRIGPEPRVPYARVRPSLIFIRNHLGIHPNVILNQLFDRYESGQLKTVSRRVYGRAMALREKAEKALTDNSCLAVEKLKETVYGKRAGYTLFHEVAGSLQFLKRYGKRGPKKYLGRSIGTYQKGLCKRVPTWRANQILDDCAALIEARPELPLAALPAPFRRERVSRFLALLLTRASELLMNEEHLQLEEQILAPRHKMDEYKKSEYGFTRFDQASLTLGMKQKAFDLMVARNCRIFRGVGRYDRQWYLSDLYLKELRQKSNFVLITTKYERMSQRMSRPADAEACFS